MRVSYRGFKCTHIHTWAHVITNRELLRAHVLHDHMIVWQLHAHNVRATATRDICDFISDDATPKGNSIVGTVQGNLPSVVASLILQLWHSCTNRYVSITHNCHSVAMQILAKGAKVSHELFTTLISCFSWNATSWNAYSSATLQKKKKIIRWTEHVVYYLQQIIFINQNDIGANFLCSDWLSAPEELCSSETAVLRACTILMIAKLWICNSTLT